MSVCVCVRGWVRVYVCGWVGDVGVCVYVCACLSVYDYWRALICAQERPVTVGRGRLQASRGRGRGMRGEGSLHWQSFISAF